MAFGELAYQEYPYINIDANATDTNKIKLTDLFEYQKLTIPAPAPAAAGADAGGGAGAAAAPAPAAAAGADEYSILNIKKQFICVKFKKPAEKVAAEKAAAEKVASDASEDPPEEDQSRIYVKRPTIKSDLNLIVLTNDKPEKILTASTINFTVNTSGELEIKYNVKDSADGEKCKKLFNAVYMPIADTHKPYFTPEIKLRFNGGKKGGGTRKTQGGRSR